MKKFMSKFTRLTLTFLLTFFSWYSTPVYAHAGSHSPDANRDQYIVGLNTTLNVAAPGVLGNDSDSDGNNLTAIRDSNTDDPEHGVLTFNSDGSFTYQPNNGFSGTDTFEYRAFDGNSADKTSVTLIVNPLYQIHLSTDDTTNNAGGGIGGYEEHLYDKPVYNWYLNWNLIEDQHDQAVQDFVDSYFGITKEDISPISGKVFLYFQINEIRTHDGVIDFVSIISVFGSNAAPVANGQSLITPEDQALPITLTGSDADNNILTYSVVATPLHGTLNITTGSAITYTPNANYNGPDSFTFKVNDGYVDSSVATVNITVTPVNDAPVALDDTYNMVKNTTKSVVASGVLGNDTDIDSSLTARNASTPSHGSVILNGDGSFTYKPTVGYSGSDSFTYEAFDGFLSSQATVTINISNDLPVANNASFTVAEGGNFSNQVNGSDANGDPLSYEVVSGVSHGVLEFTNGSFKYTHDGSETTSDSFTFKIYDGNGYSNIATVSITVTPVNDAPVAVVDSYTTNEDTALVIAAKGVLTNDTDAESNALTAVLDTNVSHGALTLNLDGSFTYTPTANWNGADSFSYHANGGGLDSNVVTVTITVDAINDAPVAVLDSYTTDEDVQLVVTAPGILSNDTDTEGNDLTAVLDTNVGHGTLSLNANGSFTYTPEVDWNGTESFTYHVNDGTSNSDSVTVSIEVNPINDAPEAEDDAYGTNEDTTLDATLSILDNDSDIDSAVLKITVDSPVSNGELTLNPDGTFSYTPDADFNGTDSFTYHISDGSLDSNVATVTITVEPINDAPVATPQELSTLEETSLDITLSGTDVDNDSLTYAIVTLSGPNHGTLIDNEDGTYTYTPDLNYVGDDSFEFIANDGELDSTSATVLIHVTAVNDLSVAAADAYTTAEDTLLTITAPGVLGNDTDVDGTDTLTAVLDVDAVNGTLTLNPDGSFTYLPDANFNGSDAFSYHVNDGTGNSNTAIVTITVTPVNDAPVAVENAYTMTLGTTLTVAAAGFLANDSDVDGNPLVAVLDTSVVSGALTFGADGSFVYTPVATGTYSFTYHAVDTGELDSNVVAVTITVNPAPVTPPAPTPAPTPTPTPTPVPPVVVVAPTPTPLAALNTAPDASAGTYDTTEGTAISGQAIATDPDGDALIFSLVTGPTNGTLTFNDDGSFTYTPNAGFIGNDSFSFVANDGELDSNTASVSINVSAGAVVVETPETPLAALPVDYSWLYWFLGLIPFLLAFLRPNIKYTLVTREGTTKTLRRRISRPDDGVEVLYVDLNDKGLEDIVRIDVVLYKRLAKHLGNMTVNFMIRDRLVQTVVIPEEQDEKFLTTIQF